MAQQSLGDQLWRGLADAVTDVREKYEEVVWGREVTEPREPMDWPLAPQPEQEPQALVGELMPPDPWAARETADPQLEQTIDGEASPWPPPDSKLIEHRPDREQDRDTDIDR